MTTEKKKRLYDYILKSNGDLEEKQALLDILVDELNYCDLDCMCISHDDFGCENLNDEEMELVANKTQDYLMNDFNSTLCEVLEELKFLPKI